MANMPQTNQHNLTPTSGKVVDLYTKTRNMDRNIGTAYGFSSITSNSGTSTQTLYYHRFATPPLRLGASGVTAQTWTYNFAAWSQDADANYPVSGADKTIPINCYVWRPGTGKVGTILQGNSAAQFDEPTVFNVWRTVIGTFAGAAISNLQDDDVIIFEVWFQVAQAFLATALIDYFGYDGTVVTTTPNTTVTSPATFIETPQDIVFSSDYVVVTPVDKVVANKFIIKNS